MTEADEKYISIITSLGSSLDQWNLIKKKLLDDISNYQELIENYKGLINDVEKIIQSKSDKFKALN